VSVDMNTLMNCLIHMKCSYPSIRVSNVHLSVCFLSWFSELTLHTIVIQKENLEDANGITRSRNRRKTDNTIWPKEQNDTMIYKTLYGKLKIEQHLVSRVRWQIVFSSFCSFFFHVTIVFVLLLSLYKYI
jgi:hypothetical protein